MQRDAFRGSTHPSARFSREELRPPAAKLRLLGAALALVYCAPAAAAQSLNIDLGTYYGTPPATYGAASGQAGTWHEAGLGLTALVDLSGGSTGSPQTGVPSTCSSMRTSFRHWLKERPNTSRASSTGGS